LAHSQENGDIHVKVIKYRDVGILFVPYLSTFPSAIVRFHELNPD
jgi:hypothetical protein